MLAQIAAAIKQIYGTSVTYDFLVSLNPNDELFMKVLTTLRNNKIRYPSEIFRVIHGNTEYFTTALQDRKVASNDAYKKNILDRRKGPLKPNHGNQELEVKQALLHKSAVQVRDEAIKNIDEKVLQLGNWQDIRSTKVYRKARSEALGQEDFHKRNYIDIFLRSREESDAASKYVQFPSERTVTHLFNKRHVNIIAKHKYKPLTVYFDATGSVVRPSKHELGKRVLYFAGVVNLNRNIVPLLQLITSRHDALTIGEVREETLSQLITIHDCCAHFMKMVSSRLSRMNTSKPVAKVILNYMSVLVMTEDWFTLYTRFRAVMILLLSKYDNADVMSSKKLLLPDEDDKSEEQRMSADNFEFVCLMCNCITPWQRYYTTNIDLDDIEIQMFITPYKQQLTGIWLRKDTYLAERFTKLKPELRKEHLKWHYVSEFFTYTTVSSISLYLKLLISECDDAMYGTWKNVSLYKKDYVELYVDTMKKEVLLNDNTRPYLVSSPTNGIKSEEDGYIALNPQSSFYGDVHFYMYILNSWEKRIYPINRFASEYGFQGMPNLDTLLTATNNTKDLDIRSDFLISRQHRPLGYSEITILISYQLQLPNRASKNYYKAFIFYSQIIQAMSVKVQTELYRQWRSDVNDKGKGFTMGALYWQLNDVWAAPSWSGIDFNGKWKMLHYYAKNFFAPIILVGDLISDSRINVYVISDLMETVFNATITVNILRWDSFNPVTQHIINANV
ncbi:hypothetical protein ILUMI_09207, partial [Ignelater luminosus]